EIPADAPSRHMSPRLFSPPRRRNPGISPDVEAVILKAMAQDPRKRYQTAADMYQAIAATGPLTTSSPLLKPTPPPVTPPVTPPVSLTPQRPGLPWRNMRGLALFVGLLILLLILPLLLVRQFLYPGTTSDPIKVWSAPNGELIGLSDGRYAFDTAADRLDTSLKMEAAGDLAKGDKARAR